MKLSVNSPAAVAKFFLIFYVVGIVGMVVPFTQKLFVALIPYSLLLSTGYLFYFHQNRRSITDWVLFALIALLAFLIEVFGTCSGLLFGAYRYGNGLGVKLFETPLLIGANWVFLVYCSAEVVSKARMGNVMQIVAASALMVMYDLLLEVVAPKMDMWHFVDDVVPYQNFVAWFVVALCFHTLLKLFRVQVRNPLATTLFVSQFLFFLVLALLLK